MVFWFFSKKWPEKSSGSEVPSPVSPEKVDQPAVEERMVVAEASTEQTRIKEEVLESQVREMLWKEVEDLIKRVPGKDARWRSEKIQEFKKWNSILLGVVKSQLLERYWDDLAQKPLQTVVYEESETWVDAPISWSELPGEEWDIPRIDPDQAPSSGTVATPVFAQRVGDVSKDEVKSESDTTQRDKKEAIDPDQAPSSGTVATPVFAQRVSDVSKDEVKSESDTTQKDKKEAIDPDQAPSSGTVATPVFAERASDVSKDEVKSESDTVQENKKQAIDPDQAPSSGTVATPVFAERDTPESSSVEPVATPSPTKRPSISSDQIVYEESTTSGDAPISWSELPWEEWDEVAPQELPVSVEPIELVPVPEPGELTTPESTVLEQEATPEIEKTDTMITHTVVKGQSLWRIVQAYFPDIKSSDAINNKINQIAQDNDIKDKDTLEVWQELKISWLPPQSVRVEDESESVFAKYRVDAWDSLWDISRKHLPDDASSTDIQQLVDKIARKNNIVDKDKISIWQTLQIPM